MSAFTQALHIVAKDARRFWPLAGLFVGVLVVDLAFEGSAPRYIQGPLGSVVGGVGLRGALLGLLTVLLATLIVHEDDISGGDAFWNSRPVSPVALLAAKALLIGTLLFVVPLGFQALDILEVGTADGMARHLAESAVYQGALLALVMAAAAVTRDLKATLLLGIVGYVALALGTTLLSEGPFADPRLASSRAFVGRLWWLVAAGLLVSYQYATGRTRRTLVGLCAIVAASAAISARLPYDLTGQAPAALDLSADPPASMEVRELVLSPSIRGTRSNARDGLDLVVATTDSEYALTPVLRDVEVVLEKRGQREVVRPAGRTYSPEQRYAPVIDGYAWRGAGTDWAQFDVRILSAPRADLVASLAVLDAVEVTADWQAHTRRIVGRLPLEVGAELTEGRARVRVEAVELSPTSMDVRVVTSWVRSALQRRSDSAPRLRLVMVNDESREFLISSSGGTSQNGRRLLLGGPEAVHEAHTLRYTFGVPLDDARELGPDWFDDARVLVYANEPAGTFRSTVRAEGDVFDISELVSRYGTPSRSIAVRGSPNR